MQQPKRRIPGLVDRATISSGFTMHIPRGAIRHWNLEVGDVLEFYNQWVDIPADLAENFRLIAVVIVKPSDRVPYGEPLTPGLKKVTVDAAGVHGVVEAR